MRMTMTAMPDVDQSQRDALVMAHVDLVKSMASRLGRRLPSQVEVAELMSVGVLGLIEAASRYQPSLGVPFDAFARRRINGAMLDALRGLDWVPRSLRKLQRDVDGVLASLRHSLGREPEAEEIAAKLGVSPREYSTKLDELRMAEVASVQSAGTGDESLDLLDVAVDDGGPYRQLERVELRRHLAAAILELPERERLILAMSYEQEMTLGEIGELIGVGESRVSQLRTQAVARLRSRLKEWLAPCAAH
jgi:RNA polymerase sigma factor for flagellar operon FliA